MITDSGMLLQSAQFDRFISAATGAGGLVAADRIVVCGTHRSGTTLLGDLLSADPRTAQLFEPFSPLSGIACVDRWYASADRAGSRWRHVIDDYVAGRNTKWRTRRGETPNLPRWFKGTPMLREYVAARVRRPQRIVVKCPYLTLSAQYLIERHDFRALFTVRHPGAFLAPSWHPCGACNGTPQFGSTIWSNRSPARGKNARWRPRKPRRRGCSGGS